MAKLRLTLKDEEASAAVAADIAMGLLPSSMIYLQGDLGAGKSFIARAIIRQIANDAQLEVPSPTFSIVQEYEGAKTSGIDRIVHCDLYRISDPQEINELNITNKEGRLILVEWPGNGGDRLGKADLVFTLDEQGNGRLLTIEGENKHLAPIERSLQIREFLDVAWQPTTTREKFFGDASTRTYEYSLFDGQRRILMNSPKQTDGPIVKEGKPYSQLAHLAEDVSAFVGVQQILLDTNLSVPKIFAEDLDEGLLLLEDLGAQAIIDENRTPIRDRYLTSAEMLAQLHQTPMSFEASLSNGATHKVPVYSVEAMTTETQLLLDWYAPRMRGAGEDAAVEATDKVAFNEIWTRLANKLQLSHLVLRDFHSPNIIWLPEREGFRRVGLIDFQDAVVGPNAYDLASLAQDARVDVSAELENQIVQHYIDIRSKEISFEETAFRQEYAIMSAQRATKILGIFVRLDERDGKPVYLKHLPRMEGYLARSLKHPVMAEYRRWCETVMKL